jgi:uncharacterized protein
MYPRVSDLVTSETELRALIGHPSEAVVKARLPALDDHCRAYIAKSPLVIVASADGAGEMDVFPKGDPPGFVRVLDDSTLAIPERPGNRRADTFSNLMQNPQVALIFLIPKKQETLRVSGTAIIVKDRWLLDAMAIAGKAPALALLVTIRDGLDSLREVHHPLEAVGSAALAGCRRCPVARPSDRRSGEADADTGRGTGLPRQGPARAPLLSDRAGFSSSFRRAGFTLR